MSAKTPYQYNDFGKTSYIESIDHLCINPIRRIELIHN